MNNFKKEWLIPAPWGQIAVVSFGNPQGDPVLLVHGRQDSAASFLPLINMLPKNYYFVGIDLPGHGKSDPFPMGAKILRLHFVAAIEVTIKHLQWTKFIYLSHSMGGEIGLFYNVIHPNCITKLILLDIVLPLRAFVEYPMPRFYKRFYEEAYREFGDYEKKVFSKNGAIAAVMRARGLNKTQAELILSRNITCVGEDQYILSWDRRLKCLAPLNLPERYYEQLFSNLPPTLFIVAQNSLDKCVIKEIMKTWMKKPSFIFKVVEGTHDVHFANPERLCGLITQFLEEKRSKL